MACDPVKADLLKSQFDQATKTYPKLERVLASGLTVREDFAVRAMTAIISGDFCLQLSEERIAKMAVNQADELILALNAKPSATDAKPELVVPAGP